MRNECPICATPLVDDYVPVVYHAIVLEPIMDCIGHDVPPMDENTIGIYSEQRLADAGIEHYKIAQMRGDPELDFDEAGMEFMVITIPLDKDLIFPQAASPQEPAS